MIDTPPPAHRLFVRGLGEWLRLRTALQNFQGLNAEGHRVAVETLVASSPRSWHGLRRIAFKETGVRAVSAAKLLDDLGDRQGLFALLEQHLNPNIQFEARHLLEHSLRAIGAQRIESLLIEAIQFQKHHALSHRSWGLTVPVYALCVLSELTHKLPVSLLSQCILLSQPDDDVELDALEECRAIFPFTAFTDYRIAKPDTVSTYYVGSSLAVVRRIASDFLISQEGRQAFALFGEALQHSDPQVQYAALYGLSRLRDERALTLFQRLASNRKHPLAHDAQRAIEIFGTKLPDVLTLVRGSQLAASPDELLRPTGQTKEKSPETLLRPSVPEPPPLP